MMLPMTCFGWPSDDDDDDGTGFLQQPSSFGSACCAVGRQHGRQVSSSAPPKHVCVAMPADTSLLPASACVSWMFSSSGMHCYADLHTRKPATSNGAAFWGPELRLSYLQELMAAAEAFGVSRAWEVEPLVKGQEVSSLSDQSQRCFCFAHPNWKPSTMYRSCCAHASGGLTTSSLDPGIDVVPLLSAFIQACECWEKTSPAHCDKAALRSRAGA